MKRAIRPAVERLGIALEPETDYELRPNGEGGCEDPRITFVEPLQRYIMTYAAFSANGPRIALASSKDLLHWERLGLATFASYDGIDFVHVDDKDASIFPVAVPNHCGNADGHASSPPFSWHTTGGDCLPVRVAAGGSRSRKHLDFLLPNGIGRPRTVSCRPV
jgi:hypothetical protein